MILFFTTRPHRYTLGGLRKSRYRTAQIRVRSYDWLFRQSKVRAATCIFTDFDRLRHFELVAAAGAFRQLREAGVRVLNDPARCCQRSELLFRLHQAGINRFRAYPAELAPRPSRFPVFLKCESHHNQDFDELIGDQAGLDRRLEDLRSSGFPLHYMLVIEFANREHRKHVYRRHTVYRIGDRLVPANAVTETSPFVKYGDPRIVTETDRAASVLEIMQNPYAETMRRVFDIAEIDYGRADFGFDGDTPAVYEINTNPAIGRRVRGMSGAFADAVECSMRMIAEAVDALDGQDNCVRLSYPRASFTLRHLPWVSRLRQP
jgi:hypothetical protein